MGNSERIDNKQQFDECIAKLVEENPGNHTTNGCDSKMVVFPEGVVWHSTENPVGYLDLTDYRALLIKVLKAVKPDTIDYWGTDNYADIFKSSNSGITDEEADLINEIAKEEGVV